MKQCEWCAKYFTSSVKYQIYCTAECREQATKEKIADRQKIVKRQKREGKTRVCAGKCGTQLSIYNDHNMCYRCYVDHKEVNKKIKEIKRFFHDYEDNTKGE